MSHSLVCPLCGSELQEALRWTRAPERETDFGIAPEAYDRRFDRCRHCGLLVAETPLSVESLYEAGYLDRTYDADQLRRAFDRIMSLGPGASDNLQRVERVCAWMGRPGRLLDVGSGLAVFAARMAERGWAVTAIDPDSRAASHAREVAGIAAIAADFLQLDHEQLDGRYELVALNKVLEHVPEPWKMLERCRGPLAPGGTIYVEVPDGEAAFSAGPSTREEFFIEHLYAFSATSLSLLADRCGLRLQRLDRLHEPSDKLTLAGFLTDATL